MSTADSRTAIPSAKSKWRIPVMVVVWVLVVVAGYHVSLVNYPLFHSFADAATVFIAASVFMVVWNRRQVLDNRFYLFVGIAFLSFGVLNFLHLLGNKDMGVFPQYGNLGPTLYIAGRYVLGVSLLLAPLFIRRKINTAVVFTSYTLVTALIVLSIFSWGIFPVTFVEGVGLTPFKIISDYVICLMLAGTIGLLFVNRPAFDGMVFRLLVWALVLSIATGLAFTLYTDPFGLTNAIGHFFQIGSYYLIYLAFVETALNKPQDILFRSLALSKEEAVRLNAELEETNLELKQDIAKRQKVEGALRESEARFLKAFHASPIGMSMVSLPEGRLLEVNESFLNLMEYNREEMIGRSSMELNLFCDAEEREQIRRELSGTGEVVTCEARLRTKSGRELTTLLSIVKYNQGGEYRLHLVLDSFSMVVCGR